MTSKNRTGEDAPAWKHGYGVNDPIYRSWLMMKNRCLNPRSKDYPNYMARGIVVCERWLDFRNFLADMGPRPDALTLERKDNDGPYCLENCEWATRKQQNNNSRNVHWIEIPSGGKITLSDAAKMFDLKEACLRKRLKSGWDVKRALNTPPKKVS